MTHTEIYVKRTLSTFLLLAAVTLGGCKDWFPPVDPTDPNNPTDRPDTVIHNDTNDLFLTRHKWCLVGIETGGTFQPVGSELERYVIFDGGISNEGHGSGPLHIGGRAHGSGGVNSFSAEFEGGTEIPAKGGLLDLKKWNGTSIKRDSIELMFLTILSEATQYVGTDAELMIMSDDGDYLHFLPCDDSIRVDDPLTVKLNENFKLRLGLFAAFNDGGRDIAVRFESLNDDSRCPLGVQCGWEGDAAINVTLMANNVSYTGELHTSAAVGPQVITLEGYDIRLVELTPYPVATRTIDPGEYVATLKVTKH
jgi:hypothetical protein